MKLEILYEDNHCLAVSKPAGVLVQGDRTGDATLVDAAAAYLRQRYDKPGRVYVGIVHRLDRPVSGVVLLARTSKAAARLSEQFRERRVRKLYRAVLEHPLEEDEGALEHFLRKDPLTNRTHIVDPEEAGARRARLRYRVLHRDKRGTSVEVEPLTGRSHQIRVQMAAIGSVIVGDVRYGSKRELGNWIALHAFEIEFKHPTRDERVSVCVEPPAAWAGLLDP